MLEDRFEIPVLINNDGDLFTYGEAIAGLLPRTLQALEEAGSSRRFRNLLGVTVGTGFGAGLVTGGELFLGDNGSGMEIWSTRSGVYEGCIAEEGVSARALRRVYAEVAGIPFDEAPSPRQISAILDGCSAGHIEAASKAFTALGEALGESLADAVCLTDGLVVIGGGVSLSHRHFLGTAVERMNGCLRIIAGGQVRRMEVKAFSLEDPGQRSVFLSQRPRQLQVPGTSRSVPYLADKSIGVGVSVLGSSEAVALGAYAWALRVLDASSRSGRCRGRRRRGRCASHG
jgi:glucokinase